MVAVPRVEPIESQWRERCREMNRKAIVAMEGVKFGDYLSPQAGRCKDEIREMYILELEKRGSEKKTDAQRAAELVVAARYLAFGLIQGLGTRDRRRERPVAPRKTMRHIMQEICAKHGITHQELISKRRTKHLVAARKEYYYRATMETPASFPQIGTFCGGRDHTTILHGARAYAIEHGLPRHDRQKPENFKGKKQCNGKT